MKAKALSAVALLACVTFCACGKGKETAAVALDEARLVVAAAKKAGAEIAPGNVFANAEAALNKAENDFKNGQYDASKRESQEAKDLAKIAETDAKSKATAMNAKKPVSKISGKQQKKSVSKAAKPSKKARR